jgi:hypothetical protein
VPEGFEQITIGDGEGVEILQGEERAIPSLSTYKRICITHVAAVAGIPTKVDPPLPTQPPDALQYLHPTGGNG